MSEITKNAGQNFSGIKKLEYVFQDEIKSCSIDLNDLKASISLKEGASWKQIYFSPGSLDHELDKEVETTAGTRYDQRIGLREPKISNELSSLFFKMKGRPVVLRITDVNLNIYLMGTDIHFVKVKQVGKTTGPFNGYNLDLVCSLAHPLPFIQTYQSQSEEGGGGVPD